MSDEFMRMLDCTASRSKWEREIRQTIIEDNARHPSGRAHVANGDPDVEKVLYAIICHAAWAEHERFLRGEPFKLMEPR